MHVSKISFTSCFRVTILSDFMNQTFVCSRSGSREDRRPRSQSLFGLHLQQRRRSINTLSHHFVDAQPCRNQFELELAGEKRSGCVRLLEQDNGALGLWRQSPSCSLHTESTACEFWQCSQSERSESFMSPSEIWNFAINDGKDFVIV